MQKVEGSSPFIRSRESPANRAFSLAVRLGSSAMGRLARAWLRAQTSSLHTSISGLWSRQIATGRGLKARVVAPPRQEKWWRFGSEVRALAADRQEPTRAVPWRSERRPGAREVPHRCCLGSRGGRASWSWPAGRGRGAAPWIALGGHGGGARSRRSPWGARRGLRLVVRGHGDHRARARCVKSARVPLRADARGGGIRDGAWKPLSGRARRARRYRRGR